MADFHFIRPWWLLGLLPLAWLLFRMFNNLTSDNRWQQEVDAELLPYLLEGQPSVESRAPVFAIGLLWLLAVVALAGPSWERMLTPVYQGLQERVLVVDVSQSMNATDVKPSRMDRVIQKLNDVLDLSADSQTALIVYSAVPYVVSPLTDDVQTIRSLLPAINTDIVPAQGSQTTLALQEAIDLLNSSKSRNGSIWLFTDSDLDDSAVTLAKEARQAGYRISVMGVGSEEGAPIPVAEGGFLKDRNGNIVVVKLNHSPLRSLAQAGGGVFTTVSNSDRDLTQMLGADARVEDARLQAGEQQRQAEVWLERGPWILLLLTPFCALVFRRGWL